MSIYIEPDKIDEMAHELKRFNRDIEDMETYLHNMIQSFVNEVDAEYSESYVREVTREIRQEIYEARQLAAEITKIQHSLALKAQNAASEYRYNTQKQAQMIMQSTMSFILDMPLMRALKGIYRIISGTIRGRIEETPKFDPTKDYATLISDSIKTGDYSNLQKYVNERDAKIASDKDLYKNTQSTGEYLISLGYVSVEGYLSDKQITYRNGKVYITIDGKKYPLDIAGIVLTGNTYYASIENIEKALNDAGILINPEESRESSGGTSGYIAPPPAQYDTLEKKAQYYLSQLGFFIGLDENGNPDIDGSWGNHSIIATIIFQYSMGITVTGTFDQTTMNKLIEAANNNMKYDSIFRAFNLSDLPPVKGENGKLDITKLITVKTSDKDNAHLTKETAVAWAYLVDAARIDKQDYRQLYPSHYDSGYRDLPTQKAKYKELGAGTAAYPGTSNHGYGIAIDFSTTSRGGQTRYGEGTTNMMIWLEDNAKDFGFEPLLKDPKKDPPRQGTETIWSDTRNKMVNNYYESWHWIYEGGK